MTVMIEKGFLISQSFTVRGSKFPDCHVQRPPNRREGKTPYKGIILTRNQIDSLIVAMSDLDEERVNDILMRSVINRDLNQPSQQLSFPFMRRVGIMWHTGSVDIGAEHFVSNIFRKRLISAIDTLTLL
jgi:hypothetical protein